eukprot:gene6728-13624_t
MKFVLASSLLVTLLVYVRAECPNACSSHGRCGAFDMCICFRNWMANDCSERVCPFGLAHVDTPKGDLDSSSGALSGPGTVVVSNSEVYPYGTTEQFPATANSQGTVLTNTAHYYMECSNKGICDRSTASCDCFPGYEGSACQRASCPSNADGMCSGHGTCQTIKEFSDMDYGNVYELWDKDATMACKCDPGYYGPDCSKRECKHGFDPLYFDDAATVRYSNWTYVIYTKTTGITVTGNYSIKFYDVHGEDWDTDPIDIGASCATVINALESLPNNVVPSGSMRCYKDNNGAYNQTDNLGTIYDSSVKIWARYWITFPKNAGKLKQIEINTHLDGNRPTLFTNETSQSTLGTFVYANGFSGENIDYVPDYCEGVTVTLLPSSSVSGSMNDVFGGLDTQTTKLLKKCLGDADGNSAQNSMANEVYNWDYGSVQNPHLVKLVDTTLLPITNLCKSISDYTVVGDDGLCYVPKSAGFYVTLYFDGTYFKLFNPVALMYSQSTTFYVFTTTGTLQIVSDEVSAYSVTNLESSVDRVDKFHSNIMYTTENLDCSSYANSTSPHVLQCLNKDDYVMVFYPYSAYPTSSVNPRYLNIYQLKKISHEAKTPGYAIGTAASELDRRQMKFDMGVNGLYSLGDITSSANHQLATYARVYKFTPPAGVEYAGECSGRGICDESSGECQCFSGYTYDDCSVQNALAK